MDNQGNALYFDFNIQYPDGPVCNYPELINCTNKPPECQCEVWQTCTPTYECIPDCHIDTHCNDNEYCDYPDGGEGNCHIGCRNGVNCGSCGVCTNHLCEEPECCSDADCPSGACIDGKCGECSTDDQCPGCALCENNICTKPECCLDTDCLDSEYCDADNTCKPGCRDDTDCPLSCDACVNHSCSNPECCIDTDCLDSEYCDADNTCKPGCRDDTDCPMTCDTCVNHSCSNPECCTDEDCVDLDNPICSADNTCVPGCRDDTMCPGFDAICDLQYTNCNYCNNTENAAGICNPGCVDDSNCPQGAICDGYHQCVREGSSLLGEIRFGTEACDGCSNTAEEEGVILHLVGKKNVNGQTICNTNALDNPASIDYAPGAQAVFSGDTELGECYKGNMVCEIVEGTVTWTAMDGTWQPKNKLIEFDWTGGGCCTYVCCLSSASLSASNPVADLVNCESVCPSDPPKMC